MGSGCDTVIEYREPGAPWRVWREVDEEMRREEPDLFDGPEDNFDPVPIMRGWNLYVLLGILPSKSFDVPSRHRLRLVKPDDDGDTEVRPFMDMRGPPPDMSRELDEWIYEWADGDARDRMGWLTLLELEAVSAAWDEILKKAGEDPSTAEVTLRDRFKEARLCLAAHPNAEVRFIYWFSS